MWSWNSLERLEKSPTLQDKPGSIEKNISHRTVKMMPVSRVMQIGDTDACIAENLQEETVDIRNHAHTTDEWIIGAIIVVAVIAVLFGIVVSVFLSRNITAGIGRVVPVIDMRIRFHMEPCAYDERTCVVVVNINKVQVGLVVDTISEVRNIEYTQISPAPGSSPAYIQGMAKIGDRVVILLEGERILQEHETMALM